MATSEPTGFPDDQQNPYAPPRAELTPELHAFDLTPIPLSLGEVLARTWQIYRDRMGICLGVVWGCWAMNMGLSMLLELAKAAAPHARNPEAVALVINGLGTLASAAFQIWVSIGQTIVILDIARGRQAVFGDVFTGGRLLLRAFLASLCFGLIVMGVVALGCLPGGIIWGTMGSNSVAGPVVLGLGLFAALVVLIVLGLRYSQFMYAIVDRDAGVADAFRISAQITRGQVGTLFALYIVGGVITMSGVLACGFGLIFTLPFYVLLLSVTYLTLSGQATADPYAKGEPLADLEPL